MSFRSAEEIRRQKELYNQYETEGEVRGLPPGYFSGGEVYIEDRTVKVGPLVANINGRRVEKNTITLINGMDWQVDRVPSSFYYMYLSSYGKYTVTNVSPVISNNQFGFTHPVSSDVYVGSTYIDGDNLPVETSSRDAALSFYTDASGAVFTIEKKSALVPQDVRQTLTNDGLESDYVSSPTLGTFPSDRATYTKFMSLVPLTGHLDPTNAIRNPIFQSTNTSAVTNDASTDYTAAIPWVGKINGTTGALTYDPISGGMNIKVGVADASLSAGDYAIFYQDVPGYLAERVLSGGFSPYSDQCTFSVTVSEKKLVLPSISLFIINDNGGSPKSYVKELEFTHSLSSTFHKVAIDFTDAGTVLGLGANHSFRIGFCFGAGTTYQTPTAEEWVSGTYYATSSTPNMFNYTVNLNIYTVWLMPGDSWVKAGAVGDLTKYTPEIIVSDSAPTSDDGVDGMLWIEY